MNEEWVRSLITDHRKKLWSPFTKAVREYGLIKEGDRVCACISGGKDSFLMGMLLGELQRHSKVPFEVKYLCLDPGYSAEALQRIRRNADLCGIPLEYRQAVIFRYVETLDDKPCYLCARMRRGALYSAAKELGCNKISLGHHLDDVVETILLSMMYAGKVKTMLPKLPAEHFQGMELIRPLYLVEEKDIEAFWQERGMSFLRCACSLTESRDRREYEELSKRAHVKKLIEKESEGNPRLKRNLFRSVENVRVETLLSYVDEAGTHESWQREPRRK